MRDRQYQRWPAGWAIWLLLVVLAGCGGDDEPLPASAIVGATPDQQSGVAGELLPAPFTGRAVATDGTPARAAPLVFTTRDGPGRLVSEQTLSADAAGAFEYRPVLPTLAGEYTIDVSSPASLLVVLARYRAISQPGPIARIIITAGDDQTTTQHRRVATPVAVRQTDRHGNNNSAAGADLVITAPPGSGYIGPTLLRAPPFTSPSRWSFSQVGDHVVRLSHANGTSANVVVHVTPTTHPLDGLYTCELTLPNLTVEARPQFHVEGSSLLNVDTEALQSLQWPLYSGTLDEATGAVSAIVRRSLDYRFQMRGTLILNSAGGASGSGDYHTTFSTPPPSGPPTGSWSCSRA